MGVVTVKFLKDRQMANRIWYFAGMEAIQFLSYSFIDQCDNPFNKILTVLGYIHICFQPYVLHRSFHPDDNTYQRFVNKIVGRLCLMGAGMMILRWLLVYVSGPQMTGPGLCVQTEWLRGEQLCTLTGNIHLGWSIPMVDITYSPWKPSMSLHAFLMFAPFFVRGTVEAGLSGVILFLAGPGLSYLLTDNLHEQAAIWCFLSVAEMIPMYGAAKAIMFVLRKSVRLVGKCVGL
ncbi:hypothetical protein KIPB_000421 [Kipferlia bialata]|uniref:Uncharacterized protein n=1 Tax=Kipferlia bialata TaxID=797122 RepID=A0A391NIY7_9EUKA|nr:hypothetical protein KIPB_000421 [Kipferlia bialata]|eukprot:g421.t1